MTDHRPIRAATGAAAGTPEEDPMLTDAVRAVTFDGDEALLWERIQRSRAAGTRVLLPVAERTVAERTVAERSSYPAPRRLRRWVRRLLLVVVVLIAAALAVVVWRPERLRAPASAAPVSPASRTSVPAPAPTDAPTRSRGADRPAP